MLQQNLLVCVRNGAKAHRDANVCERVRYYHLLTVHKPVGDELPGSDGDGTHLGVGAIIEE